ncbi:MAG TPA: hypothetical protein VKA50_11115 [Gammaproteobacteria bacterium]|nr:hypothetical protein [Gammaproteobacteria bacterium]
MSSTLFSLLLLLGAIAVVLLAYWRRRRGGAPPGAALAALGVIAGLVLLAGAAWFALRGDTDSGRPKTAAPSHESSAVPAGASPSASTPARSPGPLDAPEPVEAAPRAQSASGASGTGDSEQFPPNRALMLQHLKTLQEEIERARAMAHQERQKSDELTRRLNALESRVKALMQEIDEQDRRARQLRERLDDRDREGSGTSRP